MTAPRQAHRSKPRDVDTAVDALRARGLRVSAARRLVLEALYAAPAPITAEQIASGLAGRLPRSDLASVYRNLETLEEVGLVRHFHLGHGPGLYALAGAARSEYLVCDSCNAVLAVDPARAGAVRAADPRRASATRPRFSHFPIVGLCAAARARSPPPTTEEDSHARPAHRDAHPDGFLSAGVAAGRRRRRRRRRGATALRVADRELDEARVPLLGVLAAFIFAAQMLNFPVAGGTSGHLLGATLAAVLLGPWLACLVMAVVLIAQALRLRRRRHHARSARTSSTWACSARCSPASLVAARGQAAAAARARAFLGARRRRLVAGRDGRARLRPALELAISGTVPLGTVLPAMLGVHALIGVGEAVITVAAVARRARDAARPDRARAARTAASRAGPGGQPGRRS